MEQERRHVQEQEHGLMRKVHDMQRDAEERMRRAMMQNMEVCVLPVPISPSDSYPLLTHLTAHLTHIPKG
jgi:hypothetical protein